MERISKVGMIAGKASRAIRRLAIGFWYVATLICFPVASGWAQQAESARETQSERTNATDFQAVQLETQQQIARLQHDVARLEKDRRAVPTLLRQELDLWQQLELVTQERRSTKDYLAKHQASQVSSPFRDGGLTVPQSYLELDELRATMDAREEGLEALRLELQTEKTLTSEARGNFEANEQVRRRLHEVVKNSSGSNKLDGQRRQRLAQLKSRVLAARLDAHRDQALLLELRVDVAQSELTSIQQVLDELKGKFRLTREELELRLQYIEDREAEVRLQLAGVDARLRAAMYDRKDSEGASSENTTYAVAREESQLLRQLLSGVGNLKETWRRRYLLSNNKVSAREIESWIDESEQAKLRVAQISEKIRLRTRQRQESLFLLHRTAIDADQGLADHDKLSERRELERIIEFYGNIHVLVSGGERLCQRLIEDLSDREDRFSLADNLHVLQGMVVSIWQYEIATIDDEPITIKKLVIGLILLLCGYFLSRGIASVVAFRVLPRFGVSRSAAAVLRTVLFYLLMVALVLISLDIVSVPLTVFAFLGGAVAIGVGFGSQNLINNFISGLILLVERPIRIGDLVNVDGIDANVEHVGARSTRIRTGANLEILVPNSKFLENNVTNWTLSDTRIRTSVSVGVAYGSPVRRVIELLHQVILETEGALTTPDPIVLFQDFGDNSLGFEVHFWVQMRRMMDGAIVRSSVRVAIDEAFAAEQISIAFPQRDVHIDMQSPLEIRMADPAMASLVDQPYPPLRRPSRRAA